MFGQRRELHAVPCCPPVGFWCIQWSGCTAAAGIHTISFHWPLRAAEHGFHSDTWKQKTTLSTQRKQARKQTQLWHQVHQSNSMTKEKRNTHTHVTFVVAFYHFRTQISLQASSGYIKIFPQQQAKQMSAVIFQAPHTMGMIHGHCFHCRFPFLMMYQITWNSYTVITKKSIQIPAVHLKRITTQPSSTLLFTGIS